MFKTLYDDQERSYRQLKILDRLINKNNIFSSFRRWQIPDDNHARSTSSRRPIKNAVSKEFDVNNSQQPKNVCQENVLIITHSGRDFNDIRMKTL